MTFPRFTTPFVHRWSWVLAVVSLLIAPVAVAQEMTLTDAMAAAAQHPDRGRLIELSIERAEVAEEQQLGELLPVVSVSASVIRNMEEVSLGQSTVVNLWDYSADATVVVDLFRGRRIPSYSESLRATEAAEANARWERSTLRLAAGRAYIATLTARRNLQASDEDIALRESSVEQIKLLLASGYGLEADVAQAELSLADAQAARIRNEMLLQDSLDQLQLLTGREVDPDALVDPSIEMPAERLALEQRADFESLAHRIAASQEAELGPWFELLPTVSLVGRLDIGRPSFRAPDGFFWTLSLTATWVLFDWTSYANIDAAELATEVLQTEEIVARDEAELDRRRVLRRIDGAEAIIGLSEEGVQSAQMVREVAGARFAEGDATVLELTEADSLVFGAQIRLNLAILERDLERLELAWMEGRLDD